MQLIKFSKLCDKKNVENKGFSGFGNIYFKAHISGPKRDGCPASLSRTGISIWSIIAVCCLSNSISEDKLNKKHLKTRQENVYILLARLFF